MMSVGRWRSAQFPDWGCQHPRQLTPLTNHCQHGELMRAQSGPRFTGTLGRRPTAAMRDMHDAAHAAHGACPLHPETI